MGFDMGAEELAGRIASYKEALAAGEFPRASWPHWAAWLDTTEACLSQVLREEAATPQAQLLRKMATWVRGQILSSEGWSGSNSSKGGVSAPSGRGRRHSLYGPPGGRHGSGGNSGCVRRRGPQRGGGVSMRPDPARRLPFLRPMGAGWRRGPGFRIRSRAP